MASQLNMNTRGTMASAWKFTSSAAIPPNASLKLYLPFDSNRTDLINSVTYLASNGSSSLVTGHIGNALRLNNNGYNSTYVNAQPTADWLQYAGLNTSNYTSGITISYWVKYNSLNPWSCNFLLVDTPSNSRTVDANYFCVGRDNASHWWFGFKSSDRYSAGTVSTGVWYHIVWTITSGGTHTAYINNSSQAFVNFTTTLPSSYDYTYLYIGLNNQYEYSYDDCSIDDFRIYDSVLSSGDINTLYNCTSTNASLP